MSTKDTSSRRLFIRGAGAALTVPLAAAADASAAPGPGHEALEAQLGALDDANAIRALNQAYARLVNARAYDEAAALYAEPDGATLNRTVSALSSDAFGERDTIEVAADRRTATARLHCIVETETPIEPGGTLVDMAREQGEGFVRARESRVIEHRYVKRNGVWKLVSSVSQPA